MLLLTTTVIAQAAPAPDASPLKTIIRVKSTPLCSTLTSSVFYTIQGLQINDKIIAGSGPILVRMGKELVPDSLAGEKFDQIQAEYGGSGPAGTHDPNPALLMDNQRLNRLVSGIVHNIAVIDNILNDPKRFPSVANNDEDRKALQLKAELQAVVDQQRKNLNVFSGLDATFNLQVLIAKGDGTQGVINAGGPNGQVSHNDQDVSFQDVISGPERGRVGSPKDPTVDTDPAVSQKALGELANNPMRRFLVGVLLNERATGQAEDALTQDVNATVNECTR